MYSRRPKHHLGGPMKDPSVFSSGIATVRSIDTHLGVRAHV